jgi:pimeloyl-ACP methyl ester carboxylesterase
MLPPPTPRLRWWTIPLTALLVVACGTASVTPTPSASTPAVSTPAASVAAAASVSASPVASPSAEAPVTAGPSPRIVSVGGRQAVIDCRGEGQPTVILESGLGVPMETWDAVMAQIATTARVCRYERPTAATAEAANLPRTTDRMVDQLRALLTAAGEGPPYVLVGHAHGGLNVQTFARTFPEEVLGVVFVDAVHPELDARIEQILSPEQAAARRTELERNPEGVTFADLQASARVVARAPGFPPVSTIAIRHGLPTSSSDPSWPTDQVEALWAELTVELSQLGDPPQAVVVAANSHDRIQETEPGLVVDAIVYCLEGVR